MCRVGHHYVLARRRQACTDAEQSSGQVGDVSPDVHQVLVHAPRVLGGDWDGNSMLLQGRGNTALA